MLVIENDSSGYQYLRGDLNDKNTVVAVYNWEGILATKDFHEAISAAYLNLPFIFKIPDGVDDCKRYLKKHFIIKILKGIKNINKAIKI